MPQSTNDHGDRVIRLAGLVNGPSTLSEGPQRLFVCIYSHEQRYKLLERVVLCVTDSTESALTAVRQQYQHPQEEAQHWVVIDTQEQATIAKIADVMKNGVFELTRTRTGVGPLNTEAPTPETPPGEYGSVRLSPTVSRLMAILSEYYQHIAIFAVGPASFYVLIANASQVPLSTVQRIDQCMASAVRICQDAHLVIRQLHYAYSMNSPTVRDMPRYQGLASQYPCICERNGSIAAQAAAPDVVQVLEPFYEPTQQDTAIVLHDNMCEHYPSVAVFLNIHNGELALIAATVSARDVNVELQAFERIVMQQWARMQRDHNIKEIHRHLDSGCVDVRLTEYFEFCQSRYRPIAITHPDGNFRADVYGSWFHVSEPAPVTADTVEWARAEEPAAPTVETAAVAGLISRATLMSRAGLDASEELRR